MVSRLGWKWSTVDSLKFSYLWEDGQHSAAAQYNQACLFAFHKPKQGFSGKRHQRIDESKAKLLSAHKNQMCPKEKLSRADNQENLEKQKTLYDTWNLSQTPTSYKQKNRTKMKRKHSIKTATKLKLSRADEVERIIVTRTLCRKGVLKRACNPLHAQCLSMSMCLNGAWEINARVHVSVENRNSILEL